MADNSDLSVHEQPGSSRLTPLLSGQLRLSTPPDPPSTRQSTAQKTDKPVKRGISKSRRVSTFSSRTSRAIFDGEKEKQDETIKINTPRAMETSESMQPRGDIGSQHRKREAGAVSGLELSPSSILTHKFDAKKKPRRRLVQVQGLGDAGRKRSVLKRAMSSQVVFTMKSLSPAPAVPPKLLRCHASEQSISVKSAANLQPEPVLPTVYSSKHPDLNVITPETVAKVLRGDYKQALVKFELLDCRFSYEFEGGSLKNATSLCDPDEMETKLFACMDEENCTRTALIFFCEFSANRAPKMLRHVRNVDRRLHADTYPELHYPELYLIDGGYKKCFEILRHEVCAPSALYVTMEDERFVEECRREFASWRRRWKPHKAVTNCAANLERSSQCTRRNGHQVRPNVTAGVRSLFDEL